MQHVPPSPAFQKTGEHGFTVLLAALVASLVLSLGISVFTVAQKQLVLSSTGRNSQYAFYAADSAAECALYWDMRHQHFIAATPAVVACAGDNAIAITVQGYVPETPTNPATGIYRFRYEPNGFCADVEITKSLTHPRTLIRADGYNVTCAQITSSTRVLQRSVELTY